MTNWTPCNLKQRQLQRADLDDFVAAYLPGNHAALV